MRNDDPLEMWLYLREHVPDLAARQRNGVLYTGGFGLCGPAMKHKTWSRATWEISLAWRTSTAE
jgi:hypothetical protein